MFEPLHPDLARTRVREQAAHAAERRTVRTAVRARRAARRGTPDVRPT